MKLVDFFKYFVFFLAYNFEITLLTSTCSKSNIETLEKRVKGV